MVVRYEVKEGDRVKARDAVVVIEAMKMQNVMTSPKDGVVTSLPCTPGKSVETGETLAVIDL